MRIVYVDLHTNGFFVNSLRNIVAKKKAITKHKYIIEWLLKNGIEVADFVTSGGSTLPVKVVKKISWCGFFKIIEAKYVIRKNKFPKNKIQIIYKYDDLRDDDIVMFYGHCVEGTQFEFKASSPGIKICDLIHFYGDKKTADLLRNQRVKFYIAEVDLDKYCGLFRKNYGWIKNKYISRKFVFQNRFQNVIEFEKRKDKAVAMGTVTKCLEKDFIDYYGTDTYQPKREMILKNKDYLIDVIDSYISYYQEIKPKDVKSKEFFIISLYKKLYNFYNTGKQKSYFSFDMVEKYNEYKMFVCPEDAVGQYGIGVIEGMACGCAMIGWDYGAYEDLGLKSGMHYISYDGSVEDLKAKIEFYQKDENKDELKQIAKAGCKYIRENFSEKVVAREYYESLLNIRNQVICDR